MADTMGPKLIEVYADTRGVARCNGPNCGRRILWATVVQSGRKMCFDDPEEVALKTRHEEGTRRLIESLDLTHNHWSSCADVGQFRKPRTSALFAFLLLLASAGPAIASGGNAITTRDTANVVAAPRLDCSQPDQKIISPQYLRSTASKGPRGMEWCQTPDPAFPPDLMRYAMSVKENGAYVVQGAMLMGVACKPTTRDWYCTADLPSTVDATVIKEGTRDVEVVSLAPISSAIEPAGPPAASPPAAFQLTTITGCLGEDGQTVNAIGTPYYKFTAAMTGLSVSTLIGKMRANGWRIEWQRVAAAGTNVASAQSGYWHIMGWCVGGPQ